jgi:ubiquitin-conjugating enzyme E2 variant
MNPADPAVPALDDPGPLARVLEALCLAGAGLLLVINLVRLAAGVGPAWWLLPIVAIAGLAADLASGLVHWSADTWGRDTLPIVGPRFLRPFRVHHVNPQDLLRRSFVDCNGDVAMLNLPVLAAGLAVPLDGPWAPAAVALVALSAWSLPTNQVHQWAHMPDPPRVVGWLQDHGLILGRDAHRGHHASPYATNYCIATGWCNRALAAVEFFPRLERLVTRLTGAVPRADDGVYAARGASTPVATRTESAA